ncbi:MAG TPA: hypothetical protein VFN10_05435 [Thermoanaerobaculia bacterium]|nr:hypothetical protein [Thermoanaerobaculia bacterium]
MKRFATLIFVMLIAAAALAQDAASPRFSIERIEVRNAKRVSTDVILSESGLRAGAQYSESELRDASLRLSRLPFLLSVEFSLEKGSARGLHVLVITVSETKPFFYQLDIRPVFQTKPLLDSQADTFTGENDLSLGFRWFVGRRGAIHAGLQNRRDHREYTESSGALVVGYTQYDLFGTRAFAAFNLKRPFVPDDASISPQFVAGIPLSLNQTLTLDYDETRVVGSTINFVDGPEFQRNSTQRLLALTWSYNTTNQPVLPTKGVIISAGPVLSWADRNFLSFPSQNIVRLHEHTFGVDARAARYFELSDRDSVSGVVETSLARVIRDPSTPDLHSYNWRFGAVQAGYSHSLWSHEERAGGGDSRIEVLLRATTRAVDGYPYYSNYDIPNTAQISASWVRRSSWGTIRLGGGYAW